MNEQQEYELNGTLSPKEQPEPPKRAFLDRIFGDATGDTRKAVYKMFLVIAFVFLTSILADVASEAAFGVDTPGNEFSIGFGFVSSLLLARLAWVYKY